MKLVFESGRLLFRLLEESDLDLLIEQWADPHVVRYVGGRTHLESNAEAEPDASIVASDLGDRLITKNNFSHMATAGFRDHLFELQDESIARLSSNTQC